MGYYILPRSVSPSKEKPADTAAEIAALRARLENGTDPERRQAVLRLVALRAEDALTRCLASPQGAVVQLASAGLWECWLGEMGPEARRRIDAGVDRMNGGDLEGAERIFARLASDFPGWAEAYNKQATVLYMQGKAQQSIEICRLVVALKPDHFGAWNGLSLCAIQVEDWSLALEAIQESLRLQPRSQMNQQLLRLVESRLPRV